MKLLSAFLVLLTAAAINLVAQPFSFGLRVGATLDDAFVNNGGKNLLSHDTQRLVIGPTIEPALLA